MEKLSLRNENCDAENNGTEILVCVCVVMIKKCIDFGV